MRSLQSLLNLLAFMFSFIVNRYTVAKVINETDMTLHKSHFAFSRTWYAGFWCCMELEIIIFII